MSSFIIRMFANAKLKSAVGYALRVANLLVDAISGVLFDDGLSDAQRIRLGHIFTSIVAIRDFLKKLADIIGTTTSQSSIDDLKTETQYLNEIIDSLWLQ